jgi:hypothetical protein
MRPLVTLLLALAVTACSNTHGQPLELLGTEPTPAFFVERHDGDGRDLASTIAGAMRSRGMDATSGTADLRPADIDFVVTYEDRWSWDIRMYLTGLRIEVRDPATNRIVAFGYSFQDSLAALGKNQLDVVNRALDEMLPAR